KKDKRVFRFAEVPVWLSLKIESDKTALERYAMELAENEKLKFVRIERAKILKKQLIEIDGDRYFVTGKKEMKNGREVGLSSNEMLSFSQLYDEGFPLEKREESSEKLFTFILSQVPKIGKIHSRMLGLDLIRESFFDSDSIQKIQGVMSIFLSLNAKANAVDLSGIGGGKAAGRLQPNYSKMLSDPKTDFVIIDQSVTGMFERRTRIGL
ncbi:MAG: Cas9 endonuclease PAM-interacting domain-containing protein, partial [Eggerthellaceae bacterium]|nr:Cas9 endonuclease PAM-interacting domain-containing protein [Eggerthellaceae bacterium]